MVFSLRRFTVARMLRMAATRRSRPCQGQLDQSDDPSHALDQVTSTN